MATHEELGIWWGGFGFHGFASKLEKVPIHARKWDRFLKDLKDCRSMCMPRFVLSYVREKIVSLELHGFCDSWNVAYAAAIYVRAVTSVGMVGNLLSAKSKVAPLKAVTMPRLELLACLLLLELVVSVRKTVKVEMEIGLIMLWSDSEIALYWIKRLKKEWKKWVENRVTKIRSLVGTE